MDDQINLMVNCRSCGRQFEYSSLRPLPAIGVECDECRRGYSNEELADMAEEAVHSMKMFGPVAAVILVVVGVMLVLMVKSCVTELYFR